ncbi:MAG TPA: hypothetical protein VL133_15920, partial [Devosia sp.]|nr:hypothetical protein [Devosia sp.]
MLRFKLRGKIIGAAALVFVAAIVSILVYVVQSTQQNDFDSADQLLASVAATQAKNVEVVLTEHATEAAAVAQTISALMAAQAVMPATYATLFENQLAIVPNAIGVWTLLEDTAPTANNTALMASQFALPGG